MLVGLLVVVPLQIRQEDGFSNGKEKNSIYLCA